MESLNRQKLLFLFAGALGAVVVFSIGAVDIEADSEDSPLYEATLRQARMEMKRVLPREESRDEEEITDLSLQFTNEPVETRCPVEQTECPSKPEFTKCGVTHEPGAVTECYQRPTQCAAKTWCPVEQTACPEISTECPDKQTQCPKVPTECPSGATECHHLPTKCPEKRTACPYKETKCPEHPQFTRCGVTHSPRAPTECKQEPTLCKAETWCPVDETQCSAKPTGCPLRYTKCNVTHNPNSLTACKTEPTICEAVTWCPEIPGACPPDTSEEIGISEFTERRSSRPSREGLEPREVALFANYPNPFYHSTTTSFMMPRDGHVNLVVYDTRGTRIAILVDEERPAGLHSVTWEASGLNPGVYFLRLTALGRNLTVKATFLR